MELYAVRTNELKMPRCLSLDVVREPLFPCAWIFPLAPARYWLLPPSWLSIQRPAFAPSDFRIRVWSLRHISCHVGHVLYFEVFPGRHFGGQVATETRPTIEGSIEIVFLPAAPLCPDAKTISLNRATGPRKRLFSSLARNGVRDR